MADFRGDLNSYDWDEDMKIDTNSKIRVDHGKIISKKVIQSLTGKIERISRTEVSSGGFFATRANPI